MLPLVVGERPRPWRVGAKGLAVFVEQAGENHFTVAADAKLTRPGRLIILGVPLLEIKRVGRQLQLVADFVVSQPQFVRPGASVRFASGGDPQRSAPARLRSPRWPQSSQRRRTFPTGLRASPRLHPREEAPRRSSWFWTPWPRIAFRRTPRSCRPRRCSWPVRCLRGPARS